MLTPFRCASSLVVLVLCALLAGVLPAMTLPAAWAASGGVRNPGFEMGPATTGEAAEGWTIITQAVTGNVTRTQKDDAATYPVFGTVNGGTVVSPRTGAWMLRFGIPKGTDAHQAKGVTTVVQTFKSDGSEIGVSYRIFTWEHNDTDAFVIDVKDANGKSIGRLADKEPQSITGTTVIMGTGDLPYTLDLKVQPRQLKYRDTGWQDVKITGLEGTAGQTLTIRYTLDTNTTASHDSWVYLDLADVIPPVVSIESPAPGSFVNADPVLTFAVVDEAGGSGPASAPAVVKVDGAIVGVTSGSVLGGLSEGEHTVAVTAADVAGNKGTATSTFTLDKTPPVTTASGSPAANAAGWNSAPVTVTLTAADGTGVGVTDTYFKINGGSRQTYSAAKPVLTADGDAIAYWSVDRAGNAETAKTFAVRIDSTPPPPVTVGDADPAANAAGWNSGPVTLTLAAGAGVSGLALVECKLDDGVWTPVVPLAGAYRLVVSGDGRHAVSYRSVSVAGVTSAAGSCDVDIDGAAPQVAISSPADGSSLEGAPPALVYTAADPLSGLADGYPQVTVDGDVIDVAPGGTLPDLSPGSHTLEVAALDRAGNAESATSTFTVQGSATLTAEFEAAPERPYEGDIVGLYAADSGSEEGKTWEWTISADGVHQAALEGPIAFLTLADAGPYDVTLTVTDTTTQTTRTTTQTVSAIPQAPWVGALDVEVLDGETAKLVGRFLDPGWEQAHHATWSLTDASGNEVAPVGATVFEDNFPAMDSGLVEGVTPPLDADHGPYTGRLVVADSTGASTAVDFNVKVVPPDSNADEGQPGSDTVTGSGDSPVARGGQVHLSYIQSADDVDIFEVRTPGGDPLPYGTEVLVTLRDLPQDYDVALIQDLGAEVDAHAGLEGASFSSAAAQSYMDAPVRRGTEWDGSPVRRGTDWYDLPVRRGTDWSDLPVRRGTDWWDLPVRRGTEWDGSPVRRGTPFIDSVYLDSPVRRGTDWEAIPVRRGTDWEGIPVRRGTEYVRPPLLSMLFDRLSLTKESLDGYSFLDMGFTGLGSNTASGSTVDFAALGFDNAALQGKRIADVSAHAGTGSETVYAETTFANGRTYIAVKGANGVFSEEQPYALQVETSLPLSIYDKLNDAGITEPLVVGADQRTTQAETPVVRPADAPGPLTLFVTQAERIDALYGDKTYSDTTEGRPFEHIVLPALEAACNDQDGLVRGEVLSVPSSFYDAWDATPWSTTEANAVAERIRAVIEAYVTDHPTVEYVVLVGSDDIVPQRRVLDQTVLANEKDYYQRSWLRAKGAVAASMFDGTVLTDDYYVDAQPIPYNGRELFVPDIAVARLVETPAQIEGIIDRFLEARGTLSGGSSVVTGQDFMVDGAQRVWNILDAAALDPVMEAPESWTVADLQRDLLSGQRNVGAVNGHFTHYGGISAAGYNDQSLTGEFLTSTAIKDATGLTGKLVFTMGCHAGLSVPDDQGNVAAEYAGDLDPRLDIAQAMAIRQGVLVGSTGYGYGDSEGIAGTEALIGTFADQATTADADSPAVPGTAVSTPGRPETGQPIGLALAAAKRHYLGSLTAVTPYDEKSSIEFTMYGMPQYRLPCDTHEPTQGLESSFVNAQSASYDGHLEAQSFTLTVVDAGEPDRTYSATLMESSVDPTARYLTANGDSQATFGRPIQPRVAIDLGAAGGDPVKAAIVTGGTYVDVPAFDPAISRWTYEWEVDVKELQVSTDGWWPEKPVAVRTIGSGADREQRLIVLAGQFLATSAAGAPVVGTERVWTSLEVELVRGPVADTTPPTVSSVTLTRADNAAPVVARVAAADAAGIARIVVTQAGTSPAVSASELVGGSGPYDVSIPLPGVAADDVALTVAVVDAAGNATTVTSKGALVKLAAPTGTMTLNGGVATTYSAVVPIDSSGVIGATEMRTSTDGSTWTAWRPFAAHSLLTLPGLPGSKTVRVQYRNSGGSLERSASVTRSSTPLAAGEGSTLALKDDGSLWAWGCNLYGEVGDGTTTQRPFPTPVGSSADWVAASSGFNNSYAIAEDGSLWSWGDNYSGQLGDGTNSTTTPRMTPLKVGTDTDWAAVSGGSAYVLAVKTGGSLWSWGDNWSGQLGDGTTTDSYVPKRIGTATDWVAVSAGASHSLALKSDGSLWAWGDNTRGDLGDGTTTQRVSPIQVGTGTDWVAVSAGNAFSVALKSDGSLWAWGDNARGQLGLGSSDSDPHPTPTQVGGGTDWIAMSAGDNHCLALKSDGSLWAWGSNRNGCLGDGTTTQRESPTRVGAGSDWAAISGGCDHSRALKSDGSVWTWGYNDEGELGDGTITERWAPARVFDLGPGVTPSGSMAVNSGSAQTHVPVVSIDSSGVSGAAVMRTSADRTHWTSWRPFAASSRMALPGLPGTKTAWVQYCDLSYSSPLELSASLQLEKTPVAAHGSHDLVVRTDGTLWSWGQNYAGQVGDGTTTDRTSPVQVGGGTGWVAVAGGRDHSSGITSDGLLWTWGWNSNGQLGDGTTTNRTDPVQVGADHDWTAVCGGDAHTLALKSDGSLWAWGWGGYGQLGNGGISDRHAPTRVGSDSDWIAIAAGSAHSLALKSDGSVWAWGTNVDGELGLGWSGGVYSRPQRVGIRSDWVAIGSGVGHSFAIGSDGSLWAWGSNWSGCLGDGTTTQRNSPTRIGADVDWVTVSGGQYHTLGLRGDGSVWAWGRNVEGQLGDGTTTQRNSPTRVGTGSDWASVSGGHVHSLALKTDGSVWTWGDNTNGQLGDGTTTGGWVPKQVLSLVPWVSTLAGAGGQSGTVDGSGGAARFNWPNDIGAAPSGDFYVADAVTLRKVTASGDVTTIAGMAGQSGSDDGTGSAARFNGLYGVACDAAGNVYATDYLNNTVRKITPAGEVTTLAGTAGQSGSSDGTGSSARFYAPVGVACDADGNVYVTDYGNHAVRKITPAGVVTTIAGLAGQPGSADGSGSAARFSGPWGIDCDGAGNLYVADMYNATVRKITPAGVVTTLAGSPGAFDSVDGPGMSARFRYPCGITRDTAGNLYVSDSWANNIRKIDQAGTVSTLAAVALTGGYADGPAGSALFYQPRGVALGPVGQLLIADYANHAIRVVR